MSNIGDVIQSRRESLRWSQEKLAEKIGMNRSGLSMREQGKCNVTVEELIRIAAALGTTPAVLLGEPEPGPKPEPEQSTITETCRCGASCTATTPHMDAASAYVSQWRRGHLGC